MDNKNNVKYLTTTWLCRDHWPASQRVNGNRRDSIDIDARQDEQGKTGKARRKAGQPLTQPFDQYPFNQYHADNKNNLKCLTTKAINFWMAPFGRNRFHQDQDRNANSALLAQRLQVIFKLVVL